MPKKDNPTNTKLTGAPKRDSKGRWEKGTPPPNPAGRPADGESWSAIIKEISEMTPAQIIELVGERNDLGRAFKNMPKEVMVKKLVVARILAALMFEPSSGLWKELMDRAEGKVKEQIEHSGTMTWAEFIGKKNADGS